MRKTIALALATVAIGVGAGLTVPQSPSLPGGFTVQHADGVTYVCSVHPVYCTGNAPGWAKP